MRDAGERLARLMPLLSAADRDAFQATVDQMFRALDGLTPPERACAVAYAEAEQETES